SRARFFRVWWHELRPIELSSETLLPTCIMRWRISAADVSTDDTARFAQFSKRPLKIGHRKAAALPVRHRLFQAQAIEVDCDVDVFWTETLRKFFKTTAPVITQNRALPLPIFQWPIVCPRMNFKNSGAFRTTVAEDLMRPPTFKIVAAPDTRKPYIWQCQCPVNPSTTRPFRGPHIPIRMVIEGDEDDGFGNGS